MCEIRCILYHKDIHHSNGKMIYDKKFSFVLFLYTKITLLYTLDNIINCIRHDRSVTLFEPPVML